MGDALGIKCLSGIETIEIKILDAARQHTLTEPRHGLAGEETVFAVNEVGGCTALLCREIRVVCRPATAFLSKRPGRGRSGRRPAAGSIAQTTRCLAQAHTACSKPGVLHQHPGGGVPDTADGVPARRGRRAPTPRGGGEGGKAKAKT